ncbi:MAG TPA: C45 family peptidase [Acidobacteriaceae bacterium]
MPFARLLASPLLLLFAATALAAPAADPRLGSSYRFEAGGWTYVHLAGSPEQIGYEHGYLLAQEIEDNVRIYQVEAPNLYEKPWTYFRHAGRQVLWPHINAEYQAELKGMAAGLQAHGAKIDLWDLVALNGNEELTGYYLPWENAREKRPSPPAAVAPGKCSAFLATGSATRDGRIVMAHSNWSNYAEGEHWTVIFDIAPSAGNRMLMDGSPGMIASQDDFGVNAAGLMITETTLPMAAGFDPEGVPEFVRSRQAMQYAGSIDEYAAIMRRGNNGGYANSWLIGDRKTGEIAYLELGLRHTPLARKKDGYFVSSNFAADPELVREDTPGFDPNDLRSSMNARHVRAEEFLKEHKGQMDTALAEAFLADHYDSYEKRVEVGKRSLCGHEERSSEGEPVWGSKPFSPSGAVTGKVMDAAMAEKLSFVARAGHPCGEDFLAAPFLAAHPEFAWQKPILGDMKAGPWTAFHAGEAAPAAAQSLRSGHGATSGGMAASLESTTPE